MAPDFSRAFIKVLRLTRTGSHPLTHYIEQFLDLSKPTISSMNTHHGIVHLDGIPNSRFSPLKYLHSQFFLVSFNGKSNGVLNAIKFSSTKCDCRGFLCDRGSYINGRTIITCCRDTKFLMSCL